MNKYKKYFNDMVAGLPFKVVDRSSLFWGIRKDAVIVDLITINSRGSLRKLCELFHELGHVKYFQSLNKRGLVRAKRVFHCSKNEKYKKRDLEFVRKCELGAWEKGWKLANQMGLGKDKRFKETFKKYAIEDMKTYGMEVTIEEVDDES